LTYHGAVPSARPHKKNLVITLIAGAAGLALLTGGTTFALWTKQAQFDGGTVTNAQFDLTADAATDWQATAASPAADPDALTPGDSVEKIVPFSVTLGGDTSATVSLTGASSDLRDQLTAAGVTGTVYFLDANAVDEDGSFDPTDATATVDLGDADSATDNVLNVTAGSGTAKQFKAVVVLALSSDATSDVAGKSVDLTATGDQLGFQLLQNAPSGD
jgi:alternate signal-mediated exported protein